jgi:hypothetical protein
MISSSHLSPQPSPESYSLASFPNPISSPSSPPPGAGACVGPDPADPALRGVVAVAVACAVAVPVDAGLPSLTLSKVPFGLGTADRGIAVNVAVNGFDSCPPPAPVRVTVLLEAEVVASLPMNQPGTHPRSPVSTLILFISSYQERMCGLVVAAICIHSPRARVVRQFSAKILTCKTNAYTFYTP